MPSRRLPDMLQMPAQMTFQVGAELKTQLLELVELADNPCVDLSSVREIDTSGIQCLILAKREAARAGKQFLIQSASAPVRKALTVFGIGMQLENTDG